MLEGDPSVFFRSRNAEDTGLGDDQERHRVNGSQGSRRQNRPLHAFLPALADEGSEIAEVAKFGLVDARFCANGRWLAHLSDDHANLSRGHLHPRMFAYGVDQDKFEAEAGHEQLSLVTGLAVEGHGVVAGQLGSKALAHQPDLRGTDAVDRLENERN